MQGEFNLFDYSNLIHVCSTCSYELLKKATHIAAKKGIPVHVGDIFSSDIFYFADPEEWKKWARMGILAVEMESYALYCNAKWLGANALTILTVSNHLATHKKTTAEKILFFFCVPAPCFS